MKTSVKIFPSLMVVAVLALGLKVLSITSDFDLLTAEAVAQDQDDKKPEPPETDPNDPPPLDDDEKEDDKDEDDQSDDLFADEVITAEEEDTLKLLRERSRALDKRERMVNLKEKMLLALEKDLQTKITRLEKIKADIDIQLGNFEEAEKQKMLKLVDYYNKMKAKVAAPIFTQLMKDENEKAVLLRVIKDMKNTKVSEILAAMNPVDASKITMELATVAKPKIDDTAGR